MKRLLLVTIDPELAHGGPGSDMDKIRAAGQKAAAAITDLGFELTNCQVDLGETAEAVLSQALRQGPFDVVVIGVGIRTVLDFTVLFEKLVNVIHREAPTAKFAFNSTRENTPEAILRVTGGG